MPPPFLLAHESAAVVLPPRSFALFAFPKDTDVLIEAAVDPMPLRHGGVAA